MQVTNNTSNKFVIELKNLLINKSIQKNEKLKKVCVNVGDRYGLYITQLDSEKINFRLHSVKCFPNDSLAIIFFKKQIRDEFLNKYKIVKFVIKHFSIDANGKTNQVIISELYEDRIGSVQRMLQFLRK